MKCAIVRPLLKKVTLDPNLYQNYRPVSNLSFLSKIIEKLVAKRLTDYLTVNKLHCTFQSAYRAYHSVESALLRVKSDIAMALDRKQMAVLILLDLSAAFDTLKHSVLIDRLSNRFGIKNSALQWIRSYLQDREQYVKIGNSASKPRPLKMGVPQGSVLGPILFTLYMAPLADIIAKHGIISHFNADDSQLYTFFEPSHGIGSVRPSIEKCVSDVKLFMDRNFLKLNQDKTEIILFGSDFNIRRYPTTTIRIGSQDIQSQKEVRNLGATFDSTLSMDNFVSSKCFILDQYIVFGKASMRHLLTL